MATFKQICESVLEEANGRPVTLSSVNLGTDSDGEYYLQDPTQRNIVRWVNELNLQIQQQLVQANFMHKRGEFLTTVADKSEYIKKYVREIKANSAYAIKSGSTGRTPVEVMEYDDWLQDERSGPGSADQGKLSRPDPIGPRSPADPSAQLRGDPTMPRTILSTLALLLIPSPLARAADILPVGSAPPALNFPHFPDRMHAFIWRNWPVVEPARLAKVLDTSVENVTAVAESMGLPQLYG